METPTTPSTHKHKETENISYLASISTFTDVIPVIFDGVSLHGKLIPLNVTKQIFDFVNLSLKSEESEKTQHVNTRRAIKVFFT